MPQPSRMENFTPYASLAGGALIGLAAALLLAANGRIAGISGITGQLLAGGGDRSWRALFLLGLVVSGIVISMFWPDAYLFGIDRSTPQLIVAGLLVGIGTQYGGGCTSGHGVCGLSRFSKRSLVAVVTFMTTAAFTVWGLS